VLAVAIANTVEAMAVVVLAKAAMALCGAASSNSLCLLGRWQQAVVAMTVLVKVLVLVVAIVGGSGSVMVIAK